METTKTQQTKQDTRTEFEKRYWEYAKTKIPLDAKLVSIGECNARVEMIGVFYKMPGEAKNNYKTYLTKYGVLETRILKMELIGRRSIVLSLSEKDIDNARWGRGKYAGKTGDVFVDDPFFNPWAPGGSFNK